jgi:WhiB family transcriptional regulator, redox-sensing transcriptional regulator
VDPVRHRAIIDVFGFLDAIPERPEWHERAACRGMGADIFFIDRGGDPRPARQICATCPVRQECYDFANQHPKERFGIWGQQSERQRRGYKVLLRESPPA